MELNRKKIVAKELLIFFGCLLIFGIALLGTYSYNFVIKNSINNIENSISSLANEIEKLETTITPKLSQQKWFYDKWKENSNFQSYESYAKMWEKLEYYHKMDSIEHKWNNVWNKKIIDFNKDLGFKTSQEFNHFIFNNSLTTDDLEIKEKADSIRTEISVLKSQIKEKNHKIIKKQINFALIFLIIAGIIAYPIRIIYHTIVWSIKTLKTKG